VLVKTLNRFEGIICERDFNRAELVLEQLNQPTVHPDLILIDIVLPGMDGIELIKKLKQEHPGIKRVVLTVFDDHDRVFRALVAGADGYIVKSSDMKSIESAIKEVNSGGASLTPLIARKVLDSLSAASNKDEHDLSEREIEVLKEVVSGSTKKEIAMKLFLSVHTVDSHMRKIYEKLHVNTRAAATAEALRRKIV
jgi:DNA-binding NarL/FixJ family response regulator